MNTKFSVLACAAALLIAPSARAESQIKCSYQYAAMPFCDLTVGFQGSGGSVGFDNFVTVTEWGQSHKESLSPMPAAAGELFHFAISKENPDNLIYMVIYAGATNGTYKSALFNPQMPQMAKEVDGTCVIPAQEP